MASLSLTKILQSQWSCQSWCHVMKRHATSAESCLNAKQTNGFSYFEHWVWRWYVTTEWLKATMNYFSQFSGLSRMFCPTWSWLCAGMAAISQRLKWELAWAGWSSTSEYSASSGDDRKLSWSHCLVVLVLPDTGSQLGLP